MNDSKASPEQAAGSTASTDQVTAVIGKLRSQRNVLPEGAWVANFKIIRQIGQGGFGVTYLASEYLRRDGLPAAQDFLRDVAFKEYFPGIAVRLDDLSVAPPSDEGAKRSFLQGLRAFVDEAKVIATLKHDSIVGVLTTIESNGTAYFAMPFLRGESLKDRLDRSRKLTRPEIGSLVLPLLDGLEVAHSHGILHRDIKPANVMLAEEGKAPRPILIDFGLARRPLVNDAGQLTQMDANVWLTHGFAPIEQYEAESKKNPHGIFTDIYAFCATLYVCVTGDVPPRATIRMVEVGGGRPDPLKRLGAQPMLKASFDPGFLEAIDWGLELSFANRPQKVANLRDALLGRTLAPTSQKRRRWSLAIATLVVSAAVGAVAYFWYVYEPSAQKILESLAQFDDSHCSTDLSKVPGESKLAMAASLFSYCDTYSVNEEAARVLAQMYYVGDELPKNAGLALHYFAASARLGNPRSMWNVSLMYLEGMGIESDELKAVVLAREAGRLDKDLRKAVLDGLPTLKLDNWRARRAAEKMKAELGALD